MIRLAAKIAYDGTGFCGWQIQKKQRTVQQEIETALSLIAKQKIAVTGAGRTDAGVHARGQIAHFDFPLKMIPVQIQKALQTKLAKDIQVLQVYNVKPDFHARYDACKRTYEYLISTKPDPFNRFYTSSFPRYRIDLEKLNECTIFFLGKHDFTSFSKFNPDIKSTICEISEFKVSSNEDVIQLKISADRFLHNMVRRLVGSIINISNNQLKAEILAELINAKSTANKLISTAPPQGLYLVEIAYPKGSFIK